MMPIQRDLIYDVGMSEGNDTEFYLKKGFRVIGVEADPQLHQALSSRFEEAIRQGRLAIEYKAAAKRAGEVVSFSSDLSSQEHSSRSNVHNKSLQSIQVSDVQTIGWADLSARYGVPYYLKVDIEGGEREFLEGMIGDADLPLYISAEIMNFDPIRIFRDLGYKRFKIINQAKLSSFPIPDPPREGNLVKHPNMHHWSGLFGKELPGKRWFSFDEIERIHHTLHELWTYETITLGWLDCHACLLIDD